MTAGARKFLAENPDKFDAREWLKPAREAAKQLCKQRYLQFGCEGQAGKIKPLDLHAVAGLYASGRLAQVVT
jgi:fructose-bisphosphate aldolase class II